MKYIHFKTVQQLFCSILNHCKKVKTKKTDLSTNKNAGNYTFFFLHNKIIVKLNLVKAKFNAFFANSLSSA